MAAEPLAFEDLRVGDEWQSSSHEMSSSEIREFADLTGDFNRIHLDEEFAATTPFGKPIAHGLLGLSLMAGLSTVSPPFARRPSCRFKGGDFVSRSSSAIP